MRALRPFLLPLLMFASACMDPAYASYTPGRSEMRTFAGGAGTYVYEKPAWASWILALIVEPGSGGGAGGVGTSDSGGGGAGCGAHAVQIFAAAQINASENIILGAGGIGGAAHAPGNANGANGSVGAETSFGDPGRNLLRLHSNSAGNGPGLGGDANAGAAGFSSIGSHTGGDAVVITLTLAAPGDGGGAGDDTAAGAIGAVRIPSTIFFGNVLAAMPTHGGGGGGTTGGTLITLGGAGAFQAENASFSSVVLRAGALGGASDGAPGADGAGFVINLSTANGTTPFAFGMGGGGGAGSLTGNGGRGGDGGNCGGAGGGGGSSRDASSGRGGNGGAGCALLIAIP